MGGSSTNWGWMTHICVSKLTTIGSDNGLLPDRRQAIIWTIYGVSLIKPLGINFGDILSEIHIFSFKKLHLEDVVCKMVCISSRPQCVDIQPPQTILQRRHLTYTIFTIHWCDKSYICLNVISSPNKYYTTWRAFGLDVREGLPVIVVPTDEVEWGHSMNWNVC